MKLNIHNIIKNSKANGPGNRYVIWLQGCNFNCKNCFNPDSHSFEKGKLTDIDQIITDILSNKNIDGITISGGEPLQQAEVLYCFLEKLKKKTDISIILYTGYSGNEIEADTDKLKVFQICDVIITGRYIENLKSYHTFLSSSNQEIHFNTNYYEIKDFEQNINSEIIIDYKGNIIISGNNPAD